VRLLVRGGRGHEAHPHLVADLLELRELMLALTRRHRLEREQRVVRVLDEAGAGHRVLGGAGAEALFLDAEAEDLGARAEERAHRRAVAGAQRGGVGGGMRDRCPAITRRRATKVIAATSSAGGVMRRVPVQRVVCADRPVIGHVQRG